MALTIGGNGVNTTYSGIMSAGGSLTKTGSGTTDSLRCQHVYRCDRRQRRRASDRQRHDGLDQRLQRRLHQRQPAISRSTWSTTAPSPTPLPDNGALSSVSSGPPRSPAPISGTGSFAQNGSGITFLTANNSYQGGTPPSPRHAAGRQRRRHHRLARYRGRHQQRRARLRGEYDADDRQQRDLRQRLTEPDRHQHPHAHRRALLHPAPPRSAPAPWPWPRPRRGPLAATSPTAPPCS